MLLDLMDAHGVEKTVLVQYIGYRWDNTYVSHVLRTYPDRFAGVCRVNPEDPAAPDHPGPLGGRARVPGRAAQPVRGT